MHTCHPRPLLPRHLDLGEVVLSSPVDRCGRVDMWIEASAMAVCIRGRRYDSCGTVDGRREDIGLILRYLMRLHRDDMIL